LKTQRTSIGLATNITLRLATVGPTFLKSINPGVQRHDPKNITQMIVDVINNMYSDEESPALEDVDMKQSSTVVTHQPSVVMQAAWDIV